MYLKKSDFSVLEGSRMITVQKGLTLTDQILYVQQLAKKHHHPMLFSYVVELEKKDSLHLFSLIKNFETDREHFFWSTPERDFILCGIGIELTIENDLEDDRRFYTVEAMWNEWKSYTYKFGSGQYGTGPLLFGGYAFDPKKRFQSGKWCEFSNARFHLPQFMITKRNDQWFLTINKIISENEQLNRYAEQIKHYIKLASADYSFEEERVNCVHMNEFYKNDWLQTVEKATADIKGGCFEKVVLARDVLRTYDGPLSSGSLLYQLEKNQQTSFLFSFQIGEKCFLGATPERLIKKDGKVVYSACLAGSIKRGESEEEDEQLGQTLLTDSKNLHEHEVVVRMISKAFEDCCTNIEKPAQPQLLKTKNIQHLFTPILGTIRNGYSIIDLVAKLHPTPALGGYPKQEAMQFIREEEPMERGWYASPIGWMDFEDNGEFVVAIRSGLIEKKNAYLFAGCGIVEHSNPKEELIETQIKLGPMIDALGGTSGEK